MRASIDGIDVVGKTENRFRVGIVVLQPDLHDHAAALGFHVDWFVMQYLFAPIQVLNKFGDAAVVLELDCFGLASFRLRRALIGQRDLQALI